MPLIESIPTVRAAFEVAGHLAEARAELARATITRARCDYALTIHQALIEAKTIEAAGGDKALGANEDARKRALTLALDKHAIYQTAREDASIADLDRRMAEVEAQAWSDQLAILLAALEAGVTEIPADLLDAGLAAEAPDELPVYSYSVPTGSVPAEVLGATGGRP